MKSISPVLFILLVLSSCQMVSFEELQVETFPSQRNQIILQDDLLRVSFSLTPDRNSAEQAFSLTLAGNSIPGDFRWESNRVMTFTPLEGWEIGRRYYLGLNGEIQVQGDLEFRESRLVPFFVESQDTPLTLDSFLPTDNETTNVLVPIELNFSRSVDRVLFQQNFSLTPDLPHSLEWSNNDQRVTITPDDKWEANKRYSWTVSQGVEDTNQQKILQEYSGSFITAMDYQFDLPVDLRLVEYNNATGTYTDPSLPSLNHVTNDYQLLFRFPESIDTSILENSITFSPVLLYQLIILSDQEALICPEEFYTPQETYRIELDTSLTDFAGNPLQAPLEWTMVTQNVEYQEVLSVQLAGGGVYPSPAAPPAAGVDLTTVGTNETLVVVIEYRFPYSSLSSKLGLLNQDILLEDVFPMSLAGIERGTVSWNASGTQLTIRYSGFEYSPSLTGNRRSYYRLTIKGGSRSTPCDQNSFLEEDLVLDFHTEVTP